MSKSASRLILGLDLGVNSVGWALIQERDGNPDALVRTGVRIFDAGVEGNFEAGKATSRGVDRRLARQHRRMLERRARRQTKLLHLLQEAALLPLGEAGAMLPALDKELLHDALNSSTLATEQRGRLPHVLPYWLRAQALDRPLAPFELGRALYHLGQRRGYLSNRLTDGDDEKEEGAVKEGIAQLRRQMTEAQTRTLGEFFSRLDPAEERIRQRWTAREMFLHEFDAIWTAQAAHAPERLTDSLRKRIHQAIFFQRPLKSAKSLVGRCEFEPRRRRAALASLPAQRFRLLQMVNHARIHTPEGRVEELSARQRDRLVQALEAQGDMSFRAVKKLLGLGARHVFGFEEGGEKRFIGNRTNARIAAVLGERWNASSAEEKESLIAALRGIPLEEHLVRLLCERWGLDEEKARALARVKLEKGYAALSRRAMEKLMPLLEEGLSYAEAADRVYGMVRAGDPLPELPAVSRVMPHLRNPVVHRVLTELRKVVNSVIREHGKPDLVRIELARDMRRTAEQRKQAWQQMRRNELKRSDASSRILAEAGHEQPSRRDIEKALLWEECGGFCPYTGKPINFASLFGPEPQFDIEHIIPFSRSLDDSFLNKTLCCVKANRDEKRNRTPFEAYSGDTVRWEEILQRVEKNFRGDGAREKLRRFKLESIKEIEDFSSEQLNDTRYASRQAIQYMALLYGGINVNGEQRVAATRGGVTAFLRDVWELNRLLGKPEVNAKSRDDHRHHVIDAIVTALTTPGAIKALSDAASRAPLRDRRRFDVVEPPWPEFEKDIRAALDNTVVSFRVDRPVNGRLHEDTFFSKPHEDSEGRLWHHVRKPLALLKPEDIKSIVDPNIQTAVRKKLDELGGNMKKFEDRSNHPTIPDGNGGHRPIRKVRIRRAVTPFSVGAEHRERRVTTDSNHHMAVVEVQHKGKTRWEGTIVNRYEAMRRHAKGQPVVQRECGEGRRFVFSIAPGEILEIDGEHGKERRLIRVRSVSGNSLEFVALTDARQKMEIKAKKQWFKRSVDRLRELGARKVSITPLGEIRRAND